jgi:hypothetical protein
VRNQSADLFAL